MMPRERLEFIKQIALEEKIVYVSKLSEKFRVSEETIRRDLDKLVKQDIVTRSHGGAVLNIEYYNEAQSFYKISEDNIENKKYITEKAIDFIKEGSTIVADSSSTVLEALKLMKNRTDVTVVSNSISMFQELSESRLNIISTGGNVNSKSRSFQGSTTKDIIRKYNVDIALVGCMGMDFDRGISDLDEAEVEIKRTMINQANKVILLVDHTKYDKNSLVKLFDYEDIDHIITDKEPRNEWMNLLRSRNIDVIY